MQRELPPEKPETLKPPAKEFEIEGEMVIAWRNGYPVFHIDNCLLSEFVQRHFGAAINKKGDVEIGRCKMLIIPVRE